MAMAVALVAGEALRRLFGLKIAEVGDEPPLPEQELAPREVLVPRPLTLGEEAAPLLHRQPLIDLA